MIKWIMIGYLCAVFFFNVENRILFYHQFFYFPHHRKRCFLWEEKKIKNLYVKRFEQVVFHCLILWFFFENYIFMGFRIPRFLINYNNFRMILKWKMDCFLEVDTRCWFFEKDHMLVILFSLHSPFYKVVWSF